MSPSDTIPFSRAVPPPPSAEAEGKARPGASDDAPRSDVGHPLVGQLVEGKYLVEEILGEGAMAVVLAARHVFLDRPVALKVLHPDLVELPELRERFAREARAMSRIDHPNVVRVSDFGVTDDGHHYLVMDRLHGQTLLAAAATSTPMAPGRVAAIAAAVADGLAAIHDAGFVHRDIKPENLFMVEHADAPSTPDVRILDLGIAALLRDATHRAPPSRLTRVDSTVGTIFYMSPEQVSGATLDGRSDLYALGCVIWELLTGRPLFDAETTHDVMMDHLRKAPEPPSSFARGVPEWLDAIVLRCLAKRAADRHPDARALATALRAGLAALGAGAPPNAREASPSDAPSISTGLDVAIPRRRGLLIGAASAALAAGAALLLWPPATPPARLGPAAPLAPLPALAEPTPTAAPPPTPATAPAPRRVTLGFDISPAGAEVRRDGRLLGATPLTVEVDAVDGPVTYTVTHPGHRSLVIEVPSESSFTWTRTLASIEVADAPAAPVAGPREGAPVARPPSDAATPAPPTRPRPRTAPAPEPRPVAPSPDRGDELWRPAAPPESR